MEKKSENSILKTQFCEKSRYPHIIIDEKNKVHIIISVYPGEKVGTDNTCASLTEISKFFGKIPSEPNENHYILDNITLYLSDLRRDIQFLENTKPNSDLLKDKKERYHQLVAYQELMKSIDEFNVPIGKFPAPIIAAMQEKSSNVHGMKLSPLNEDHILHVPHVDFRAPRSKDANFDQSLFKDLRGALAGKNSDVLDMLRKPAEVPPRTQVIELTRKEWNNKPIDSDASAKEFCAVLFKYVKQYGYKGTLEDFAKEENTEINYDYLFSLEYADEDDYGQPISFEYAIASFLPETKTSLIFSDVPTKTENFLPISPFEDLPDRNVIPDQIQKKKSIANDISIRVQFLLGLVNSYCQDLTQPFNLYDVIFNQGNFPVTVIEALSNPKIPVEDALLDYLEKLPALKHKLNKTMKEKIKSEFFSLFAVIKATPHFDEFLILIPEKEGAFYTHQAVIGLPFSEFCRRYKDGKLYTKFFEGKDPKLAHKIAQNETAIQQHPEKRSILPHLNEKVASSLNMSIDLQNSKDIDTLVAVLLTTSSTKVDNLTFETCSPEQINALRNRADYLLICTKLLSLMPIPKLTAFSRIFAEKSMYVVIDKDQELALLKECAVTAEKSLDDIEKIPSRGQKLQKMIEVLDKNSGKSSKKFNIPLPKNVSYRADGNLIAEYDWETIKSQEKILPIYVRFNRLEKKNENMLHLSSEMASVFYQALTKNDIETIQFTSAKKQRNQGAINANNDAKLSQEDKLPMALKRIFNQITFVYEYDKPTPPSPMPANTIWMGYNQTKGYILKGLPETLNLVNQKYFEQLSFSLSKDDARKILAAAVQKGASSKPSVDIAYDYLTLENLKDALLYLDIHCVNIQRSPDGFIVSCTGIQPRGDDGAVVKATYTGERGKLEKILKDTKPLMISEPSLKLSKNELGLYHRVLSKEDEQIIFNVFHTKFPTMTLDESLSRQKRMQTVVSTIQTLPKSINIHYDDNNQLVLECASPFALGKCNNFIQQFQIENKGNLYLSPSMYAILIKNMTARFPGWIAGKDNKLDANKQLNYNSEILSTLRALFSYTFNTTYTAKNAAIGVTPCGVGFKLEGNEEHINNIRRYISKESTFPIDMIKAKRILNAAVLKGKNEKPPVSYDALNIENMEHALNYLHIDHEKIELVGSIFYLTAEGTELPDGKGYTDARKKLEDSIADSPPLSITDPTVKKEIFSLVLNDDMKVALAERYFEINKKAPEVNSDNNLLRIRELFIKPLPVLVDAELQPSGEVVLHFGSEADQKSATVFINNIIENNKKTYVVPPYVAQVFYTLTTKDKLSALHGDDILTSKFKTAVQHILSTDSRAANLKWQEITGESTPQNTIELSFNENDGFIIKTEEPWIIEHLKNAYKKESTVTLTDEQGRVLLNAAIQKCKKEHFPLPQYAALTAENVKHALNILGITFYDFTVDTNNQFSFICEGQKPRDKTGNVTGTGDQYTSHRGRLNQILNSHQPMILGNPKSEKEEKEEKEEEIESDIPKSTPVEATIIDLDNIADSKTTMGDGIVTVIQPPVVSTNPPTAPISPPPMVDVEKEEQLDPNIVVDPPEEKEPIADTPFIEDLKKCINKFCADEIKRLGGEKAKKGSIQEKRINAITKAKTKIIDEMTRLTQDGTPKQRNQTAISATTTEINKLLTSKNMNKDIGGTFFKELLGHILSFVKVGFSENTKAKYNAYFFKTTSVYNVTKLSQDIANMEPDPEKASKNEPT